MAYLDAWRNNSTRNQLFLKASFGVGHIYLLAQTLDFDRRGWEHEGEVVSFCMKITTTCMRWFGPPPIVSTEEWRARPHLVAIERSL